MRNTKLANPSKFTYVVILSCVCTPSEHHAYKKDKRATPENVRVSGSI